MFDGLVSFVTAIGTMATPWNLFNVAWATQLGIVIGMLPGLTATMGVALLTTLTYTMDSNSAILVLICIYIGAIYGGSRSAILINIPGTPANAAACLDGYQLTLQGQAGRAIGISTSGSFLGTIFGMVCLMFFTPIIGNIALEFQSFEYFWFSVFGVLIAGNLTSPKDPLKGWISGFIGLWVTMIGMEGIHAYVRFDFGLAEMAGGITLIPVMVGMFGFAEVLSVMMQPPVRIVHNVTDRVIPRLEDVTKHWRTILRSGAIGTFIGALPGVGEDIASWVSYSAAKRASKEPEKYGHGSVEGMMAAETGDNACVPGAIIPVLALAVPGSAPAAVLLAAMLIHGVRPGPLIMIESPQFVYEVVAMVLLASIAIFIYGLIMVRPLMKVLSVPRERLMPIVFVLCIVGTYAISNRMFDVWVMLAFGVFGFILRRMDYPMAPLILGVVLGDIMDKNLRRGLVLTDGSLEPFFTRPISLVLVVIIAFTILMRFAWFQEVMSASKRTLLAPLNGFKR